MRSADFYIQRRPNIWIARCCCCWKQKSQLKSRFSTTKCQVGKNYRNGAIDSGKRRGRMEDYYRALFQKNWMNKETVCRTRSTTKINLMLGPFDRLSTIQSFYKFQNTDLKNRSFSNNHGIHLFTVQTTRGLLRHGWVAIVFLGPEERGTTVAPTHTPVLVHPHNFSMTGIATTM